MKSIKLFDYQKHILYLLFIGIIFQFSCKEDSTIISNNQITYLDYGSKALVLVEENNGIVGFSDENLYSMYKQSIIPVLSEIFTVPDSLLKQLSLKEMIEQFGEPWQIRQIAEAANGYYDKIIVLNNETATLKKFIDTLKSINNKYTIDLILNLHGSQTSVVFSNGRVGIGILTDEIKASNTKIRAVYQTCCYGKYMIASWRNIDVIAVNGSEDYNILTLFSPAYFISEWTSGKVFEDAVYSAYNMEIQKMKTYNNILPIESYLLTPSNLFNSIQSVSGKNSKLLWKECPVF
jgi:hypothetical protein